MLASTIASFGAGAPSHSAAKGTFYFDTTNNTAYVNTNGSTNWRPIYAGQGYNVANVAVNNTGVNTTSLGTTGSTTMTTVFSMPIYVPPGATGLTGRIRHCVTIGDNNSTGRLKIGANTSGNSASTSSTTYVDSADLTITAAGTGIQTLEVQLQKGAGAVDTCQCGGVFLWVT